MSAEDLARLREPFPPEHVGLLPRITCPACSKAQGRCCNEHNKSKCDACGNYITSRHMHLDYVGHGAVTDRLLEVDPGWSWEPLGIDDSGMPTFVYGEDGKSPVAFWIRLTVLGVTRLGVGTCEQGQSDAEKVLIGDALRNAAMRFGVALDLWIKGHAEDDERTTATSDRRASSRPEPVERFNTPDGELIEVWPGEVSARAAKAEVVAALGGDKDAAAKAWSAAGFDGKFKVRRDELAPMLALLSGGTEPAPNEDERNDAMHAANAAYMAESPAPTETIDARAIAQRSNALFEAAIGDGYPPRKKTWLNEQLRHALVYVATNGEATSSTQLEGAGYQSVWRLLDALESGKLTFEWSADPGKGVEWRWPDGSTSSVLWTELNLAEAGAT